MSQLAQQRIREAKEKRLTRLDIGNCGLTEIPEEVFELVWLEELILSNTWAEYSAKQKGWYRFKSQNGGQANDIKFISPNIKLLRGLKKLIVSGKYESKWSLSDLSPLKSLSALQHVDVNNTQVSDLSPLKKMFFKGVFFKRYPNQFKNEGINYIFVEGCPINNPPKEIINQGHGTILRYFEEQDRVGLKKVNEARLLLVGQGASGKTTLKDKLIDKNAAMPEPDATTRGIVIAPIICQNTEGADFTVQVWDFGGQNIQKYAHQFFMSDSVVYAVLSNTREQNANFQYWLNIIELLGKDSPFFIVQNEKDGHKEPLTNITQIQERFPQTFQGVRSVNLKEAATDPRFTILKDSLFVAATQLPHTQKEYLTSFVNVRNQLATLSQTTQAIPFRQFKDLCKAEGVEGELINDYARTLTLLGIALHFEDDLQLKTQVFLRPKWIIDALFALLYAPSVEKQSGRFSALDVENIWTDDAYEGLHSVLLQLMEKFYLCYALPHSRDYIVPQRLPIREKAFVPTPDATHILYKYKFLPSGLLTQLTCRLHTRIEGDKVWNDAVQFQATNGDGRVFVRENNADNSIELFGFGQHKAELINTVVDTIDAIHQNSKFGNLKVDKLVPCPCPTCATARERKEIPMFFDYNFLIELLRDGETESDRCTLSKKRFPIKTILKHAFIRLLNKKQIEDLLAADNVEKALDIMRRQFKDSDEVIVQLSILSRDNQDYRMEQITKEEYSVKRNKRVKAILEMLKDEDD
jgi:internalin A